MLSTKHRSYYQSSKGRATTTAIFLILRISDFTFLVDELYHKVNIFKMLTIINKLVGSGRPAFGQIIPEFRSFCLLPFFSTKTRIRKHSRPNMA